MIAIISPARTIRASCVNGLESSSLPYSDQTRALLEELRRFSPWELESVLRTNPKIALQAYLSFQDFQTDSLGTPSLISYHGLAYKHLNPMDFTSEDFSFAENHLRIVSAFYGLLRPSSGIHPYRLEMISRLNVNGKNLYQFWGNRLADDLFIRREPIINLCSAEYARVVMPYVRPHDTFISCRFLESYSGSMRCLATASKEARGQMVRYIIKNRIQHPQHLWRFDWGGYSFSPNLSNDCEYIFVR